MINKSFFWARMSPRFVRYLIRLGLRYAHYLIITTLKLEAQKMRFINREGKEEYNFALPNRVDKSGVAAIMRAKNEEDKIAYALGSIYDVFDQIVVVDNGSTDRTLDIVKEFKKRFDAVNKIDIQYYPFKLARCGPEHDATPEDSLHSIVYFTNYAMSFCKVRCLFRFDADMVLCQEKREKFAEFIKKAGNKLRCRWLIPGQTLYRTLDGTFARNSDELSGETRLFPCSYHNRFIKFFAFEVLYSPLPKRVYPHVVFYELKFASADEFTHWSSDFKRERHLGEDRFRAGTRNRLMWDNLKKLQEGRELSEEHETLSKTFLDDQLELKVKPSLNV